MFGRLLCADTIGFTDGVQATFNPCVRRVKIFRRHLSTSNSESPFFCRETLFTLSDAYWRSPPHRATLANVPPRAHAQSQPASPSRTRCSVRPIHRPFFPGPAPAAPAAFELLDLLAVYPAFKRRQIIAL